MTRTKWALGALVSALVYATILGLYLNVSVPPWAEFVMTAVGVVSVVTLVGCLIEAFQVEGALDVE